MAIIYLCCDDLDRDAFKSLTRLRYRGKLYLIVHDDSTSEDKRAEVDAQVEQARRKMECEVALLRRPSREGGKPSAINYVLQQTGDLFDYFLLCDNDSTILEGFSIEQALAYFEDPDVAIVQCRSIAVKDPHSSRINRLLSRFIDTSDLILTTCSRFGWQPFLGHNAFLRTRAVLDAGALTPGFFHDDLDLAIRLNLRGRKVIYAPEIPVGEKHPPSYRSFRGRNYKWAYGCIQTLRANAWPVLSSRRLTLTEKFSFFQYTGFYVAQTCLLLYLVIIFLAAPFFVKSLPFSAASAFFVGTLLSLVVFLPSLSYLAKDSDRRGLVGTVLMCGLVYGVPDLAIARGIWDGLWNRKRQWIPTNVRVRQRQDMLLLLAEPLLGVSLLYVALFTQSTLLYFPFFYLLAAKFIFGPALSILYDDQASHSETELRILKTAQVAILVVSVLMPALLFRARA